MSKELWHEQRGPLLFVAYESGGLETIEASAIFQMRMQISQVEAERAHASRADLEKTVQRRILAHFLASIKQLIPEVTEAIRALDVRDTSTNGD